jgi:serine/threonine protein phosphatase 1
MFLQKEEYNVRFLMGNHEDYLIKAYDEEFLLKSFLGVRQKNKKKKEWMFHGGKECLESYGISDLKQFPKEHIDWMRKLEYYIELEDFILVHAGFNFNLENIYEDTQSMLWVREYDIKPEKIKNKKLIHGHVPVNLEFIDISVKSKSYKFIDMDNGVYIQKREGFGNLVALELNSLEYRAQPNLDF